MQSLRPDVFEMGRDDQSAAARIGPLSASSVADPQVVAALEARFAAMPGRAAGPSMPRPVMQGEILPPPLPLMRATTERAPPPPALPCEATDCLPAEVAGPRHPVGSRRLATTFPIKARRAAHGLSQALSTIVILAACVGAGLGIGGATAPIAALVYAAADDTTGRAAPPPAPITSTLRPRLLRSGRVSDLGLEGGGRAWPRSDVVTAALALPFPVPVPRHAARASERRPDAADAGPRVGAATARTPRSAVRTIYRRDAEPQSEPGAGVDWAAQWTRSGR